MSLNWNIHWPHKHQTYFSAFHNQIKSLFHFRLNNQTFLPLQGGKRQWQKPDSCYWISSDWMEPPDPWCPQERLSTALVGGSESHPSGGGGVLEGKGTEPRLHLWTGGWPGVRVCLTSMISILNIDRTKLVEPCPDERKELTILHCLHQDSQMIDIAVRSQVSW